uniref:AB hydrolase-1 domain-containing protein n=1 Tax=Salix viminalis TaxID=40686 RepID=A0A6N2LQ65_SALVM
MTAAPPPPPIFAATGLVESETEMKRERESLKEQVTGFLKSWGEMAVDLGKGCKDIVTQSNLVTEDSFIVQKFGKPMAKASARLKFLNEFLPEDRDPVLAWSVIFSVFVLALAAQMIAWFRWLRKRVYIRLVLIAYCFLMVDTWLISSKEFPVDRARFSVIAPHSFLSSRLAGIPGVKTSLLHEFGVRLVTYDLPGFGESDPHIIRNLNSSAMDMLYLANAVGVNGKFWVLSYSSGSMHSWAALRYIPDRIAGAGMFAPMINPYEPSMTKEEMRRTWNQWSSRKKLLYFLARKFPKFLAYFYHRSFLSGNHGQIDKWMSQSLGMKDEILIKEPMFEEFWHRDVEESIRQGSTKSFIEEAVLQVSNWGFSIADLQVQRKCQGNGFLLWLQSMISHVECELVGFLGPIHIWQGMDDQVVPPSMIDYISRVLPGANLHTLPNEGHFSYYFFCDECHRRIFSTLFGDALGPLDETILTSVEAEVEEVPSTTNSAGK